MRGRIGAEVIAGGEVIVLEAERLRGVAAGDHDRAVRWLDDRLPERNPLEVCAIIAAGLESHGLELAGNVLGGNLVSTRGGAAAFE